MLLDDIRRLTLRLQFKNLPYFAALRRLFRTHHPFPFRYYNVHTLLLFRHYYSLHSPSLLAWVWLSSRAENLLQPRAKT